MSESVSILNPKNTQAAEELIPIRDQADYHCFMILRKLTAAVHNKDPEVIAYELEQADLAIDRREIISDNMLRIIAGREPNEIPDVPDIY